MVLFVSSQPADVYFFMQLVSVDTGQSFSIFQYISYSLSFFVNFSQYSQAHTMLNFLFYFLFLYRQYFSSVLYLLFTKVESIYSIRHVNDVQIIPTFLIRSVLHRLPTVLLVPPPPPPPPSSADPIPLPPPPIPQQPNITAPCPKIPPPKIPHPCRLTQRGTHPGEHTAVAR